MSLSQVTDSGVFEDLEMSMTGLNPKPKDELDKPVKEEEDPDPYLNEDEMD